MRTLILPLLVMLAVGCDQRAKPAGNDHGASTHATHDATELEPITVTMFGPKAELFMEYPPLIKGQPATFLAHFSVLATGEPVRNGSVSLHLAPKAGGPKLSFTVDKPARDGLFKPEAKVDQPGEYVAELVLTSEQVNETFQLGKLVIYADKAEAEHGAVAGEEPADAVPFLMEQQWKIGALLDEVRTRKLVQRLQVPAEIEAAPGGSAIVSSSVAGRLIRDASTPLPRVGDKVKAGQIVAYIEPPLPVTADLALRAFDLNLKSIEVEQTIVQSRQRMEFAQRSYDRVKAVREKGVGTDQQLDEAKQILDLAKAEQEGAVAMREHFKAAAAKLEELRAATTSKAGKAAETMRLPLTAPIGGTIVSVKHVEGEHVESQQEVSRIVNADRVWVVGRISEFDLGSIGGTPGGVLKLAAHTGKTFPLAGDSGAKFIEIGTLIDPASRTVPIRYELPNPDGLIKIGMLGELSIETSTSHDAVAVPESAVVMDRGRPVIFVLLGGEMFQRREVELGIRDNGFVQITSSVRPGERVVVKGANAVRIASLSPASFGHGHAH